MKQIDDVGPVCMNVSEKKFNDMVTTIRSHLDEQVLKAVWDHNDQIEWDNKMLNTYQTLAVMINGALYGIELENSCFIVHYAVKPILEEIIDQRLYIAFDRNHVWLETQDGNIIDAGLQFRKRYKKFALLEEFPEIEFLGDEK